MEQTKIYTALKGVRGRKPVDLAGARAAAGAVQPAGGRAAVDQGDRHQPAAGLARTHDRARRARRAARRRVSPRTELPRLAIRPYPTQYVEPLDHGGRHRRDDPADPAGRRAADGQVPRDALRPERLPAVLPRLDLEPAHRARAADCGSASSTTTARWRSWPRSRILSPARSGSWASAG